MNKLSFFEHLLDLLKRANKPIYISIMHYLIFCIYFYIFSKYFLYFIFVETNYPLILSIFFLIAGFILSAFFANLSILFIIKELLTLDIFDFFNGKTHEIKCSIDLINKHIFIIKDGKNSDYRFIQNNYFKSKNKEISNLLQIDDFNYLRKILKLLSSKSKITISNIENTEVFINSYSVFNNIFYADYPNYSLDMFVKKLIKIYFVKEFTDFYNKAYLLNGKIGCFKFNDLDNKDILIAVKNTILLKYLFNIERNTLLKNSKRLFYKDVYYKYKEKLKNLFKLLNGKKTRDYNIDTNELKDILNGLYILSRHNFSVIVNIGIKYNQYIYLDYTDFYVNTIEEKESYIYIASLKTKEELFTSARIEENSLIKELANKLIISKLNNI